MRRLVVVLIVGLAMGYSWGYQDGNGGKGTVFERTLQKFGTSKIKDAQDARERRVQDASKP
jgi:hypothetical protein